MDWTRPQLKLAHRDVQRTADAHVEACHRLHDMIAAAMDDGEAAADLAELLGVHRQRIYHYAQKSRTRQEAPA